MDYQMITTTFSAIFLTLTISLFFHLSTSQQITQSSTNLVQDICKQAALIPPTKFEDCVASFAFKPDLPPSTNLKNLAQITLKSGISNATEAIEHVEGLMAGATVAPAWKGPLRKCLSWISAAKDSFGSSLVELDEDLESANYDVKIAGDDARNCRETLAAGKVAVASVEVRVGYLILYSNIGDVITDVLYKKTL